MAIKNVNDRKKASEQRDALYEEWQELEEDADFDNTEDAATVWAQIQALDAEIEKFDAKFPGALKTNIGAREEKAGKTLAEALKRIDELEVSDEQKNLLRKEVTQAAKKSKGYRTRALHGVETIEDMQSDLADLRERLDTAKGRMESAPLYARDKYFDQIDDIENEIAEKEFDLGVAQRAAMKATQDLEAAATKVVEDIEAVAYAHDDDVSSDDDQEDSESLATAKALYGTAYAAYTKHVNPHIPNDASIEEVLGNFSEFMLETAQNIRETTGQAVSRDRRRHDAVMAFASLFNLPGAAFAEAMKANDQQPRVAADWRDVLNKVKDKATGLKGSGDKLADSDAKAFTKIMTSLEPQFQEIFQMLPPGKPAKQLLSFVESYQKEAKYLRELSRNQREVADYPGFAHVMMVVADSMDRYTKLMKRALS